MVWIKTFEIKNFKGISRARIDLPEPGQGSIVTLIGLNESGKTTILQAISEFITNDISLASLYNLSLGSELKPEANLDHKKMRDIVPKHRQSKFDDEVSICADVVLSDEDQRDISAYARREMGLKIEAGSIPATFRICQNYLYENTQYKKSSNTWALYLTGKLKGKRKDEKINGSANRDEWLQLVTYIRQKLPKICYFPTLLFDIPDRIYISRDDKESEVNRIYRRVIQDIMDSQGGGFQIEDQIVQRIRPPDSTESWTSVWPQYISGPNKPLVDQVLSDVAAHLSKEVMESWNEILGQKFRGKKFDIELGSDPDRDGLPFLKFIVRDGVTRYAINDRSLGFRWFFSFLMFTKFRSSADRLVPTVFLFDEPASNLHAKAQLQLLKAFSTLAEKNASIVYSTHSMYLIDPTLLEAAYIVDNKAFDYAKDTSDSDFVGSHTDISAIKYRTFVGSNGSRESYFQPVLDRLQCINAPTSFNADAIILEGKSDFYFFEFCRRKLDIDLRGCLLFPGAGAGAASSLIALGLGYGRKFVVVCDDDPAGRRARDKYRKEYLIGGGAITFGDLSPEFSSFKLEQFLSSTDLAAIKVAIGASKLDKQEFSAFFAEQCHLLTFELSCETEARVRKFFNEVLNLLYPNPVPSAA